MLRWMRSRRNGEAVQASAAIAPPTSTGRHDALQPNSRKPSSRSSSGMTTSAVRPVETIRMFGEEQERQQRGDAACVQRRSRCAVEREGEQREDADQELGALRDIVARPERRVGVPSRGTAATRRRRRRPAAPRRTQGTRKARYQPRSERRNCASSSGMIEELVETAEPGDALGPGHVRPQHAHERQQPEQHRQRAAGVCNSRRTVATSSVGISATSQATIRICEIEVDHGIATATATASQSASRSSAARSKARPIRSAVHGIRHRALPAPQRHDCGGCARIQCSRAAPAKRTRQCANSRGYPRSARCRATAPGGASRRNGTSTRSSAPSTSIFSASIVVMPASARIASSGRHGTETSFGLPSRRAGVDARAAAVVRVDRSSTAPSMSETAIGMYFDFDGRIGREIEAQTVEDAGLRLDREDARALARARRHEQRVEPDIRPDIDEGEVAARGEPPLDRLGKHIALRDVVHLRREQRVLLAAVAERMEPQPHSPQFDVERRHRARIVTMRRNRIARRRPSQFAGRRASPRARHGRACRAHGCRTGSGRRARPM